MIPEELKKTHKLLKELNSLEALYELDVLKIENPELADQFEATEGLEEVYEAQPEEQYKKQINESYLMETEQLNSTKIYFLGCSLETYTSTYENRLEAFKSTYKDAAEHNFIYDELELITNFTLPSYIDRKQVKAINYSLERTKEFLIKQLEKLGFTVSYSINETGLETLSIKTQQKDLSIKKLNNTILCWSKTKTKTDLMELAKAIYEADCADNVSQSEFFDLFLNFFNTPIEKPSQILTKIARRTKDKLVLIPQLESTMLKWIDERPQNKDE